MATKQTCPECGSDLIVTDARVMLNTMEFRQFCYDGSYDCCIDCGAEDIRSLVEVEVPDEPEKPSIAKLLSTAIDYLIEVHAEENGELVSAHDDDAPVQGLWPEGCTYCRLIVDGLEALGDVQRLNFLRGLYPCEACGGTGYLHSNDSNGNPEVQRCDACLVFSDDEQAQKAEQMAMLVRTTGAR
jgi:hypothetical protein